MGEQQGEGGARTNQWEFMGAGFCPYMGRGFTQPMGEAGIGAELRAANEKGWNWGRGLKQPMGEL